MFYYRHSVDRKDIPSREHSLDRKDIPSREHSVDRKDIPSREHSVDRKDIPSREHSVDRQRDAGFENWVLQYHMDAIYSICDLSSPAMSSLVNISNSTPRRSRSRDDRQYISPLTI